ncbi:MAG: hypothetical protein WC856_26425 [Methylococcaceae bacterium]
MTELEVRGIRNRNRIPGLGAALSTRAIADRWRSLNDRFTTQYSHSVLFSVILSIAGRYLSVRAGHAPADYEYADPKPVSQICILKQNNV